MNGIELISARTLAKDTHEQTALYHTEEHAAEYFLCSYTRFGGGVSNSPHRCRGNRAPLFVRHNTDERADGRHKRRELKHGKKIDPIFSH